MNRTSITKCLLLVSIILLFITACSPSAEEIAFQSQEAATDTLLPPTEMATPTSKPLPTATATPFQTTDYTFLSNPYGAATLTPLPHVVDFISSSMSPLISFRLEGNEIKNFRLADSVSSNAGLGNCVLEQIAPITLNSEREFYSETDDGDWVYGKILGLVAIGEFRLACAGDGGQWKATGRVPTPEPTP